MKLKNLNKNERGTYAIVDIETGEVLDTFRLKAAADYGLLNYSKEQRTKIEVRKVK